MALLQKQALEGALMVDPKHAHIQLTLGLMKLHVLKQPQAALGLFHELQDLPEVPEEVLYLARHYIEQIQGQEEF